MTPTDAELDKIVAVFRREFGTGQHPSDEDLAYWRGLAVKAVDAMGQSTADHDGSDTGDFDGEERRTRGPELRDGWRLDVVEYPQYRYSILLVQDDYNVEIVGPRSSIDAQRLIMKLSGALHRSSEHERDPVKVAQRIEEGLAQIDGDYARPDYARHLLVDEVKELRDRETALASERDNWRQAAETHGALVRVRESTIAELETRAGSYLGQVQALTLEVGQWYEMAESILPEGEIRSHDGMRKDMARIQHDLKQWEGWAERTGPHGEDCQCPLCD